MSPAVRQRRVRGASAAALAALLVGCLAGSARPDRHYRLEAPAPAERLAEPVFAGTLVVERPRGDALTAGRPLVYRAERGSPELHRHAYSLWVDTPTAMLQHAIADHLRAAGVANRVVTSDLRVEGDFVLTSRLARMERVVGGRPGVELSLEFAVLAGHDRRVALFGTYLAERDVDGSSVEDSVLALREALGEVLSRFIADAVVASRGVD